MGHGGVESTCEPGSYRMFVLESCEGQRPVRLDLCNLLLPTSCSLCYNFLSRSQLTEETQELLFLGCFHQTRQATLSPTARPKGRKFSYIALFLSSLPHPNLASLPHEPFLPLSSIARLKLNTLPALSLENAKMRNLPRIPRLPMSTSAGLYSTRWFRTHARFGRDFLLHFPHH